MKAVIVKCPDCGYFKETNTNMNLCPYHDYIVHMVRLGLPKPTFNLIQSMTNKISPHN